MSKLARPESDQQVMRIRSDSDNGELLLVGKGRWGFIWAGQDGGNCITISGQQTLRKLAKAILENIPARKKP